MQIGHFRYHISSIVPQLKLYRMIKDIIFLIAYKTQVTVITAYIQATY